ncbi:zinc finger protein ZPR1 [Penicillium atrosanguineum]|nr:zinc finger protein ZPR1 [Penicillium atrosanguineum]KAJ5148149.1 zinc finger protein ZPR1 [Penicillium atrosanguineum]
MSAEEKMDEMIDEQMFQKPGDLVERDDDTGLMQLESMCMNCHKNGETRLLLIRIPYFRDVILESFECEHCHFKNNSIKSAGQIQEKGCSYTVVIENELDMQKQVVKSDGLIQKIHEGLAGDQPARKEQAPELHDALEPIINKLKDILEGNGFPFTISLDDYTGNSWIAPSIGQDHAKKYQRREYFRTHEQNEELGISNDPNASQNEATTTEGETFDSEIVNNQVYTLPAECPACYKPCVVNCKSVDIPHFKQVLLFSTVCGGEVPGEGGKWIKMDGCGYRNSDIKTGGEVPEKGKRIKLSVESEVDLSRDILKSDTCCLSSEELDLTVQSGSLGGRFTTVEGLLTEVRDQLHDHIFDAVGSGAGDSMASDDKNKWDSFFAKLNDAIAGKIKFTITLEDPMASSYVQDLCSPAKDEQIFTEEYTRTDEEEEELGLKDMKTENYEEGHAKEMAEKAAAEKAEAEAEEQS